MQQHIAHLANHAVLSLLVAVSVTTASLDPSRYLLDKIENRFNVPKGYYIHQGVNYSDSFIPQTHSCLSHARSVREPYTSRYWRRYSLAQLAEEQPVSFWKWEGNITEALFRNVSSSAARYKIVGGRFFVDPTSVKSLTPRRLELMEELLTLTVYMYPIPDMEFLVSYRDLCHETSGKPIFNFCARRDDPNAGFTMPSATVWQNALGVTQMAAYHSCLRERYPVGGRIPQVVWRGSSSGQVKEVSLEACMQLLRVRVHMLGRQHPDIMDAKLTHVTQECGEVLKPVINDTAKTTHQEEINRYCAILDVDGNTWSDRFTSSLVHFPTPVLKVATNYTGYAEHIFAPNVTMEQFDTSLVTLVKQVEQIIADCRKGDASRGHALARRSQATAQKVLDHVGIVSSMAYGLMEYQRLSAWKANTSLDGYQRVSRRCCSHVNLPVEMLEELNEGL